MSIWFKSAQTIAELKSMSDHTMIDYIGIELTEVGDDYLKATMPVDHRTIQVYGILHGGASVALAETIGSFASAMVIDTSKYICVGLDINANHIRAKREGKVTATARPLHLGTSTHVWEIRIVDEQESLICISRLTVAILQKK
jgi:1,4-dihydroxy-2-naphthoyl-CoA hydrolase